MVEADVDPGPEPFHRDGQHQFQFEHILHGTGSAGVFRVDPEGTAPHRTECGAGQVFHGSRGLAGDARLHG